MQCLISQTMLFFNIMDKSNLLLKEGAGLCLFLVREKKLDCRHAIKKGEGWDELKTCVVTLRCMGRHLRRKWLLSTTSLSCNSSVYRSPLKKREPYRSCSIQLYERDISDIFLKIPSFLSVKNDQKLWVPCKGTVPRNSADRKESF